MAVKSDREYRNLAEILAPVEDEKIVRGYATTFDQAYLLYKEDGFEMWEIVDRHAFDNANTDDTIMQYDHAGRVFARRSNGTLNLVPDEHGLAIEANLGGTEIGRQLYEEIKGGYTTKMSFGFTVADDKWERRTENGVEISTRTILGIRRLYDVSAVSLPANDATSISARSLADGEIARLKAERLERERLEAIERKRADLIARCKNERNDAE